MRVLVLWEDPREQDEAENLANALVGLAPQLAHAHVDKYGGVEIRHSANYAMPNVHVRAMSLRDAPPGTPEHAEYVTALERAVFKVDEPQPQSHAELRLCTHMTCQAYAQTTGNTKAQVDQHFRDAGWDGHYCPTHAHFALRGN